MKGKSASEGSDLQLDRKLAVAIHAADLGVWEWDLRTHEFIYSERARVIFGFTPDEEITRERIREILHPEDLRVAQAQAARGLDPTLERRDPYRYRIYRASDGAMRWIHAFGEPVFETVEGAPVAVKYIGTIQDVTEEVLARQQLADQEARLRLAIESSGIAVWEINIATQQVTHSPELNRLCGFPPDARPTLEELRSRYAPGERERIEREGAEARAKGETRLETEIRHLWPDGTEKWLLLKAQLAPGETDYGGRIIGALVDITEQRKREEQQALLLAEFKHRIKNSFSIMQSIISQTLRGEEVSAETRAKLHGRFQAMSDAHEVIAAGAWESASAATIIHRALSTFGEADSSRVSAEVEDVAFTPRAALSFSLMLHELLTNAVKYGALANETGHIEVALTRETGREPATLLLEWSENGGPAVEPDTAQAGFGTRLIDRLFAQEFEAEVQRNLTGQGLRLAVRVPLNRVSGEDG